MDELTIRSDRETLTVTLLETAYLLQQSNPMTYKLSSYRALGRVLFLLQHLCRSHLSPSELATIRSVSRELSLFLVHDRDRLPDLDYSPLRIPRR